MKYSEGFKASIVKQTQDGSGRTIAQVAREVGLIIPGLTLRTLNPMGTGACKHGARQTDRT